MVTQLGDQSLLFLLAIISCTCHEAGVSRAPLLRQKEIKNALIPRARHEGAKSKKQNNTKGQGGEEGGTGSLNVLVHMEFDF